MNPLFQMFGQNGGMGNGMMAKFQQFRQMFRGDPNQKIQEMLNSGKVNQSQYDQAVRMAQQFKQMMGK